MLREQSSGTLIGITSGNHQGSVAQANYSAAKGGIISPVRSAALGLHRYGVTANAVAPVARTRMSANVPMELTEIGEPEDVAALVVYLLSDRAREITGQVYAPAGSSSAGGSSRPQREIALYAELYRQGRLLLDELVTRTYAVEDFAKAVEDTREGRVARGVLMFGGSDVRGSEVRRA